MRRCRRPESRADEGPKLPGFGSRAALGTTEDGVERIVYRTLISRRPLEGDSGGNPAVPRKGGEDRQGFAAGGDLVTARRLSEERADEVGATHAGRPELVEVGKLVVAEGDSDGLIAATSSRQPRAARTIRPTSRPLTLPASSSAPWSPAGLVDYDATQVAAAEIAGDHLSANPIPLARLAPHR